MNSSSVMTRRTLSSAMQCIAELGGLPVPSWMSRVSILRIKSEQFEDVIVGYATRLCADCNLKECGVSAAFAWCRGDGDCETGKPHWTCIVESQGTLDETVHFSVFEACYHLIVQVAKFWAQYWIEGI